jgi:hypothetical protein
MGLLRLPRHRRFDGHQLFLMGEICSGVKFIKGTLMKTVMERHNETMSKSAALIRLTTSVKSKVGDNDKSKWWTVQDLTKRLLAWMAACIGSGNVHRHWQIWKRFGNIGLLAEWDDKSRDLDDRQFKTWWDVIGLGTKVLVVGVGLWEASQRSYGSLGQLVVVFCNFLYKKKWPEQRNMCLELCWNFGTVSYCNF